MTEDYLTFKSYVYNHETVLTHKFINLFGDSILVKLPKKICSSKILYDSIRSELDTYYKQSLFRETFMEYFRWKILYV